MCSLDFHFVLRVQGQQVQVGQASPGRFRVLQLDERLAVPQNLHRSDVPVQTEQIEHPVTVYGYIVQPVNEHYSVGTRSATLRFDRVTRRWRQR